MLANKLYVSYGSNMNKSVMRRRCPDARPLGKFMLTQAKLVFRGVADVEFCPGSEVPCALWMISARDERELDRYEGVGGRFYFKSEDILLKWGEERRPALIYLMNSQGVFPPTQSYVDRVRQGYRDFGLDEAYLDAAIQRSWEEKNPTRHELERRARQRKDKLRLVALPESVAVQRLDHLVTDPVIDAADAAAELTKQPKPKKAKKKKGETVVESPAKKWRREAAEQWLNDRANGTKIKSAIAQRAMVVYGD
jgi:hypothetical protein